jgi:membrane protein required for beta-lactamase induction
MVAMSRQAEAPRRHFLLRAASFTIRRVLSLIDWSPCSTIGASANLDSLIGTVQVLLEAFQRFCGRKRVAPKSRLVRTVQLVRRLFGFWRIVADRTVCSGRP